MTAPGCIVAPLMGNMFAFVRTISVDTANYDIRAAALAAGWNGTVPLFANITVNGGVNVYSNSTGTPAFQTNASGSIPSGSLLQLNNAGRIIGCGGVGGGGGQGNIFGSASGGAGTDGGPALNAQSRLAVNNTGSIVGGGGGGGGGGGAANSGFATCGGGGGGGGGYNGPGGAGGGGAQSPNSPGAGGSAGTFTAGGTNGSGGVFGGIVAGSGGVGGYGTAGGNGTAGNIAAGAGGAGGQPGNAVTNNANITWIANGTRTGPIV